jgi:transposase
MIRGGFLNSDQRDDLEQIVHRPSEAHGVARRANAILLLDDGMSCARVAKVLYLDDDTIRQWRKRYLSGGFDELATFDWKGGCGLLTRGQEAELAEHLGAHAYRSTNQVRAHIRNTYGEWFCRSGCIKLMHRLGFEYKKPKGLPAHANEADQREFIEKYQALARHLPENEAIYFADAVHPEYQSRPAHGWFRKGGKVALKRTSGRKRVNIHGALNLETFDCPMVEVERIDADSTIALYEKVEARNPGKRRIHVIVDNARYHHAKKVRHWLERPQCRINPIFLPAYAPNLNAIERLWGVMHERLTHNKFYQTFDEFARAIESFITQTIPKDWTEFRDTVTDNFRIISFQDFRVLE